MNELTENPSKVPNLSHKRKLFVEAFLAGKNQTKAAIAAGYSKRSAYNQADRLMKYDDVVAYMVFRQAEIAEQNKITMDEIVSNTREIIERCMQHTPVLDKEGGPVLVETPKGDVVPAYTFQAAVATKGNELLAKLGGLLNEPSRDNNSADHYIGIIFNSYPHPQFEDKTQT